MRVNPKSVNPKYANPMRARHATSLILGLVCMAAMGIAAAARPGAAQYGGDEAATKTMSIWLRADMTVDETGHVTSLEWLDKGKIESLVTERFTPVVKAWVFEPAMADGVAATADTALLLNVIGTVADDGSVTLGLKSARTGIRAESMPPPQYPARPLRQEVDATVSVVLAVDANGTAAVASMDFAGSSGAQYRRDFTDATTDAVKTWVFKPEVVAGRAVAGKVRMPITYCAGTSEWCFEQSVELSRQGPLNIPVALESAVKLRTDISAL